MELNLRRFILAALLIIALYQVVTIDCGALKISIILEEQLNPIQTTGENQVPSNSLSFPEIGNSTIEGVFLSLLG